MPRTYSNSEYADMVYLYGFCDGNTSAARREYAARFPNRRLPNKHVFSLTFQRLKETGSFTMVPRAHGVFAPLQNERRTAIILQHFDQNPSTSVRRSGSELGISPTVIWKTLSADGRHPFHIQRVQHLLPADIPRRRAFCDWFLNQTNNDPQFWQTILWTDEATFTRQGILNQRNSHIWSHENPRAIREQHFQHNFQCNVWLGIINNTLIGPHFLPVRLNANNFLEFLNTQMDDLLENIPLNLRRNFWFQLDGCPAHYGRGPRQWLNVHFPGKWIGRAGPVAWPPRSPDLTPLDFFVWGTLKQKVYEVPINDLQSLQRRIVQACEEITDVQCQSSTRSVIDRCNACLRAGGYHFEQNI